MVVCQSIASSSQAVLYSVQVSSACSAFNTRKPSNMSSECARHPVQALQISQALNVSLSSTRVIKNIAAVQVIRSRSRNAGCTSWTGPEHCVLLACPARVDTQSNVHHQGRVIAKPCFSVPICFILMPGSRT